SRNQLEGLHRVVNALPSGIIVDIRRMAPTGAPARSTRYPYFGISAGAECFLRRSKTPSQYARDRVGNPLLRSSAILPRSASEISRQRVVTGECPVILSLDYGRRTPPKRHGTDEGARPSRNRAP